MLFQKVPRGWKEQRGSLPVSGLQQRTRCIGPTGLQERSPHPPAPNLNLISQKGCLKRAQSTDSSRSTKQSLPGGHSSELTVAADESGDQGQQKDPADSGQGCPDVNIAGEVKSGPLH